MDRADAIRRSLTAFICGIVGFLPVIGLVPGFYALICWRSVRVEYGNEWNPAAAYLSWGARLALLGLLNSAVGTAAVILALVEGACDWF
jgi:hypothetical protein